MPSPKRRPSLAESMKAVGSSSAALPAASEVELIELPKAEGEGKPGYRRAATREGKVRLTTTLDPALHKRIKHLSVDTGISLEELMREALADLLAKRNG